jgi:O-antigen ligase
MLTMSIPRSNALWVGIAGVLFGILAGVMVGAQPLYLGLGLGAIAALVYFFADFERAVLGLLIIRSALDIFAAQQLPVLHLVGLDALTLLYVVILLLTSKTVKTDRFWWFFAGWVALQGIWLVLMPLGGLGLDASYIGDSLKEWIRLFSFLMVYLLVMQLKGRVPPEKVISVLFISLLIPLTLAFLQTVAPSILPPFLSGISIGNSLDQGSRIKGTFGHANNFASYLLLFMSLIWWKLSRAKKRWPWLLLMGILGFFFVGTKALFSLAMLAVFIFVLFAFRANLKGIFGGVFLFALIIALFSSTEYGQKRLSSLQNTPILNPQLDISRTILSSRSDNNSFNWRISQWNYLLGAWQNYPYLGYGLGTSIRVSTNRLLPHNDYVRALVEGGILGFSTFVFFLVAQVTHLAQRLRRLPKESSQRSLCMVLFALLMSIPVGMFTENIWNQTTFFFYWWTLFAVAGGSWNEQSPKNEFIPSSQNFPVSRMKEYNL